MLLPLIMNAAADDETIMNFDWAVWVGENEYVMAQPSPLYAITLRVPGTNDRYGWVGSTPRDDVPIFEDIEEVFPTVSGAPFLEFLDEQAVLESTVGADNATVEAIVAARTARDAAIAEDLRESDERTFRNALA